MNKIVFGLSVLLFLIHFVISDEDVVVLDDSPLLKYLRTSALHALEVNYPMTDILFFRNLAEKQVLLCAAW
jgi:hypothetical protein